MIGVKASSVQQLPTTDGSGELHLKKTTYLCWVTRLPYIGSTDTFAYTASNVVPRLYT